MYLTWGYISKTVAFWKERDNCQVVNRGFTYSSLTIWNENYLATGHCTWHLLKHLIIYKAYNFWLSCYLSLKHYIFINRFFLIHEGSSNISCSFSFVVILFVYIRWILLSCSSICDYLIFTSDYKCYILYLDYLNSSISMLVIIITYILLKNLI